MSESNKTLKESVKACFWHNNSEKGVNGKWKVKGSIGEGYMAGFYPKLSGLELNNLKWNSISYQNLLI